jgi:NAD(P)-dependent dehydrogenase (short-subunit alcohol dehydrogenase family)
MHPYPLSPQNLIESISGWIKGPNIPDQTGKVAVVSGFNSGIGYHTTRALLEHGAEVGQHAAQSSSANLHEQCVHVAHAHAVRSLPGCTPCGHMKKRDTVYFLSEG